MVGAIAKYDENNLTDQEVRKLKTERKIVLKNKEELVRELRDIYSVKRNGKPVYTLAEQDERVRHWLGEYGDQERYIYRSEHSNFVVNPVNKLLNKVGRLKSSLRNSYRQDFILHHAEDEVATKLEQLDIQETGTLK